MLTISVARRKLSRVMVNEAHLALQWSNFRQDYHLLGIQLRPRSTAVPMMLLSATLPPSAEEALRHRYGLKFGMKVLREPTPRKNLVYMVCKISSDRFEDLYKSAAGFIKTAINSMSSSSRIIAYAPTRGEVDKFGAF